MKTGITAIVLIVSAFVANFQAQTNSGKKSAMRSPSSEETRRRAISVGVVNGKAIDLVKPDYPRAAKSVNARGAVNVQVLINEKGSVIEAKALSGHPLLHAASVAAALKSTFEPVTLSGRKINAWGVIVYIYSADFFNWLEIGTNIGRNRIMEMLPPGFEEEKLLYTQYQVNGFNKNSADFQKVLEGIEKKLSADEKSLWLFRAGMLLTKFSLSFPNKEQSKIELSNLKNHVSKSPGNVSPFLISKLKDLLNSVENTELNLYNTPNGSKFHKQMIEINEKMYLLGN